MMFSDKRNELLTKIFKGSGIRTRHMVLETADQLFHGRQGLGTSLF